LRFDAPAPARFLLPAHARSDAGRPVWADGAVFYAIFVDRWHRGASSPPDPRAAARTLPSTADRFFGGDLDGIAEHVPWLASLGVTALLVTPIFTSPTPHRYDPTDLFEIDPALGGEAALARLVEAVHAHGLRLVVDVPLTHVNHGHAAFQDLLAHQQRSAFASWFEVRRWPVVDLDPSTYAHYYDRPELPWLRLTDAAVRAHVIAAVARLAALGVDGVRLDAMDDAPDALWLELRASLRARHPDLLFLGEVVVDNLSHWTEERGADVATFFQHRDVMLDFFARGRIDARELWSRTRAELFRVGPLAPPALLLFADNHDTARFRSLAITHERLRLALTWLLTRPECVALTYGTELGLAGGAHAEARDGVWCERAVMPPVGTIRTETLALLRALLALRRTLGGDVALVHADGPLVVVARGRTHWIALNAGPTPRALPPAPPGTKTLVTVNEPPARDAEPRMIGAFAGRVLLLPG
ncbi:hypothetical protein L6R52_12385, partial [Myxococcota bacterium]|nr:hypothetical protein [Myxococcota bacterium]